MKVNLKQEKGITLIALVITIVVLLILAGVTIAMLTGDNGILTKAQTSKTKSAEEEARERVSLMLAEWKMENAINGISLDQFFTTDTYEANRKSQNVENIEKEDTNYIATVDVNGTKYEVTINAEDEKNPYIEYIDQAGKRLSVVSQVRGYTFTGTVDVEIKATAPDGDDIKSIETISGITSNGELTVEGNIASRIYTVSENNTYSFTITTKNNVTKTIDVKVDKILLAPVLNEDMVTATLNTIKIDTSKIASKSNYPASANVQYIYYYKSNTETSYTQTTRKYNNRINSRRNI